MDFAPHGNLRDYLRARDADEEPTGGDVISDVTSTGDSKRCLTYEDLLSFALQVAQGLQFLAERLVSDRARVLYNALVQKWLIRITLYRKPISELWSVTCHIGSHSVSYHVTQVEVSHYNPSQTGRY